ncbi:STAS/SEC14 domain-containing protein [Mycobacterium sp. Y57]|uniref:STAS/SEC14 domain-containing protein n=1 Tax=Mycolicibacterium xanthum TaxID=2796469 RepID=UPI001C85A986|nr:STAS/SEC14 domain-containing protein [Mycolicibacterium xanthum]MBX7433954.1 STAS/SEC14 domain-containing protein [Mycolicibacterium xanthum]
MIDKMERSHDSILGFQVSGDVTREDYDILEPPVRAAIEEKGSIRVLLDLTDFHWEKAEAWGADFRFGKEHHNAIERMAIVGNHEWEKWLTRLAQPFYARQARYFSDADEAWTWLES